MDSLSLSASLDDLANLFEFGDIELNNLPTADASQYHDHDHDHTQHADTHPSPSFNELGEAQAIPGTNAHDFGGHQQFAMPQDTHQGHHGPRYDSSGPFPTDSPFPPAMQQNYQPPHEHYQFQGMTAYPMNQQIPPTPNSYEMHGEQGHFLQLQSDSQQRALLEQRYQLGKEDVVRANMAASTPRSWLTRTQTAFTPMVSPAGTPQYKAQPEYTVPCAYFSPLTSPMLHAQNSKHAQHSQHQGYYTNPSTAPSSNAASPLGPSADVDMLADELLMETTGNDSRTRKSTRRKGPTPRNADPLARVQQSPIQKAIKRKSGSMLSTLAPSRDVDGSFELQQSRSAQPTSAGSQPPQSDRSANGSISPEPLSEALMGPPPRPSSSRTHSPAIRGQQQSQSSGPLGKAATPKSLLSMPRGGSGTSDSRSTQDLHDMDLEELQLPAAADESVRRPSLSLIMTSSTPAEGTARLSARKTPKLGPLSTPSSAKFVAPSPSVVGSPMTASTPDGSLKERKESKSIRSAKKRGSISNGGSILSPALRPRISPSIKPLLPEGAALHSPTHALLLASKSNYQNLLEGNQLPGVNYPESLSTGLTSKRTSHKVAEQGRRNRINDALKEMQSLLPKPAHGKGNEHMDGEGSPELVVADCKDSKEDSLAKSNSSKASTVESANEYIRKLQRENAALLVLKKEHDEMKKRLEAMSRSGSSVGSTTSVKSASPEAVS